MTEPLTTRRVEEFRSKLAALYEEYGLIVVSYEECWIEELFPGDVIPVHDPHGSLSRVMAENDAKAEHG